MAKLRMKNWEIKLFLGIGMAKTSLKSQQIAIFGSSKYLARNM
jgi:hypothetical protein